MNVDHSPHTHRGDVPSRPQEEVVCGGADVRSPKKGSGPTLPVRCVFAVEVDGHCQSGDAEQAMDMLLDSLSSLINTSWCEGVIRTHHFRRHS